MDPRGHANEPDTNFGRRGLVENETRRVRIHAIEEKVDEGSDLLSIGGWADI
jgi:hypothetical protein